MTTEQSFERITDSLYVNSDWSITVEKDDQAWVIYEHNRRKASRNNLTEALAAAEAFERGERLM